MKLLKSSLFALVPVLFCFGSMTNSFSQTSLFSYEKYVNAKGETLNYRQLVSDYDYKQVSACDFFTWVRRTRQ